MKAFLSLLLLAGSAFGQSLKLPPEIAAEPGMILVPATTDCATVEWWAPDGGVSLIPAELLKESRTAVCFALKPGRFRLVGFAAKGDKPVYAVTTLVVGQSPEPPGPGPGPPDPPNPPTPQPDGAMGLIKASREGLAKVTVADKAKQAAALAAKQKAHAAAVAAGAFAGPAAILDGWRQINREAVNASEWAPWGQAVSAQLSALHSAGKLTGNAAWSEAFKEVATGLGG
jgi:hypothetical protein